MSGFVTYDKRGRARDGRGRFLSQRTAQVLTYAETGQITKERVGGRTFYRGPDGKRVAASVGALQGETRTIIGKGNRRREIHPEAFDGEKTNKPRGYDPATAMDLHFNSASKTVGDIAANGGTQFVQWGGKFTRIRPDKAGGLQDVFRAIHDRYIELFKSYTESPQLSVPFIETSAGDVYNMDKIETMGDELAEGFTGNEDAEKAAVEFNAYLSGMLNDLLL